MRLREVKKLDHDDRVLEPGFKSKYFFYSQALAYSTAGWADISRPQSLNSRIL